MSFFDRIITDQKLIWKFVSHPAENVDLENSAKFRQQFVAEIVSAHCLFVGLLMDSFPMSISSENWKLPLLVPNNWSSTIIPRRNSVWQSFIRFRPNNGIHDANINPRHPSIKNFQSRVDEKRLNTPKRRCWPYVLSLDCSFWDTKNNISGGGEAISYEAPHHSY